MNGQLFKFHILCRCLTGNGKEYRIRSSLLLLDKFELGTRSKVLAVM